jgi:hypothetical protein
MAKNIKVIYTPEGGSRKEWTVDLENPAWDITFATEKATDWPWAVFRQRLMSESAIAYRALLWVLRKRDEPKLAIESVQPAMDEIDFAAECPDCKEWVSTEDDTTEHVCSADADAAVTEDPEAGEA